MGFDVVYLPPIHPIGRTHRKGPNNTLEPGPDDPGSPWAIGSEAGGHDAVHPDLGTIEDFDAFVARANELGMEIALDYALQCSPDHPWVRDHPDWFRIRPDRSIAYAENPISARTTRGARGRSARRPAATTPSTPTLAPSRTSTPSWPGPTSSAWRSPSTTPCSARPTTPGSGTTRTGSGSGPTARSPTPRTRYRPGRPGEPVGDRLGGRRPRRRPPRPWHHRGLRRLRGQGQRARHGDRPRLRPAVLARPPLGQGPPGLVPDPARPLDRLRREPDIGPDDPGSPWAIGSEAGGHDAVHPDLGTIEDFDAFVARANELGMEIALDYALQCSPDHPWVRDHPDWFRIRPDGSIAYAENPPKVYQDIYPLNFDSPDAPALYEACKWVLDHRIAHGVRIIPVDNPHTKPVRCWAWLIAAVKAEHPDVLFLAEAF